MQNHFISIPCVYCDSAIRQHLLENEERAKHYKDAQFSIKLNQDLCSIYQFWEQPTSIPYSLFFAVKKNLFIYSKFQIISYAHFWLKQNNIFPPIKSSKWQILTNQTRIRNFLYCINLYHFRWFLQHLTSLSFQYSQPIYIYHCILVFLHSSIDSWREFDKNVQSKTAFLKATHFLKSENDSFDTIRSYFEILYH